MARAIDLIERDIAALQEVFADISQELHAAYTSYLTNLGQGMQRQLVVAVYHLCTQAYPENFLRLSLNQRQKLQQSMRMLGQKAAERLQSLASTDQKEQKLQELLEQREQQSPTPQDVSEELEELDDLDDFDDLDDLDELSNELFNDTDTDENDKEEAENIALYLTAQIAMTGSSDPFANPIELAKWQHFLENGIQHTLRKASREANVFLQKAGILAQNIPEAILEAAVAVSETSGEAMPGPPNILNLVVEVENEEQSKNSGLTQIMAINLRLAEIEFADVTVGSGRKQIRNILGKLQKLGREYQAKLRELAIAQAEAAWRASWYEQ
ncbi:MAG: hypothetical protein QNJ47_05755 [Nostocaceae cyanobacterium]|nr:hypothetical protein [Nostocaceae cyanobacterium]